MAVLIERDAGAPADFPFPEKIARLKAGLSEEDARALRAKHLKIDVDFVYHKKSVFLNAGALKKIAPDLVTQFEPEGKAEGIPALPGAIASEVVKLLVVRADLPNTRQLLACPVDDDPDRPLKKLRVRVRSQEGFRRRSVIEARLVPGYEDMYDLVGKYPRRKAAATE